MRGKYLYLIAALLVLMASEELSFAVRACDVVQRPCNITVTNTGMEDLIAAIFRGTGVIICPNRPVHARFARPQCEWFTYIDTRGRPVRTSDCDESQTTTVTYSTYGNERICDVLDALLRPRGYCWWTLGPRLCIDKAVKTKHIEYGRGYLHNQFRDQMTIFKPRKRGASPAGASASGGSGIVVVESYTAGAAVTPAGAVFIESYEAGFIVY